MHEPDDVRRALLNPALVPDTRLAEYFVGQNDDIVVLQRLHGSDHACHRSQVAKSLSPLALEHFTPAIQALANDLCDVLPRGEPVHFGRSFARPLVLRAACRILGVTPDDEDHIVRIGSGLLLAGVGTRRRQVNIFKLYRILANATDPCAAGNDGLAQQLLRGGVGRADVLGLGITMLVAGELTARAVLACVLATTTGDAALPLTDREIDRIIGAAGIATAARRVALFDTRVGSKAVAATETVELVLFPEGSTAHAHWSIPFGLGTHFCLGASWTRLLARVGSAAIVSRLRLRSEIETQSAIGGGPGGFEELVVSIDG